MDFDHTLEKCGNYGRYQFIVLMLYGLINVLSSLHYFTQTLITFTPEHWCHHEKLGNSSFDEIRQIYASIEDTSCTRLDDLQNGTGVPGLGTCNDWIFNYESGYESITTELNWVCENGYKSAFGQSFFFLGSVIGTITFGFLSDRIGRLPALMLSVLSGASGDFLTSFVQTLPFFAVTRFMAGLSNDTIFFLMYIIAFEYLKPEKRTFGLNIMTCIFYCAGLFGSPWYAIWVGSWRKYLWIASLPALSILLYPLLICESAQWKLSKSDYEGAVKCLKHVAKVNRKSVDESVFEEFVSYYKQKSAEEKLLTTDKKDTFFGMLRTPRLRKFTIILLIKSMIITMTYDVVNRNMEGLGSSPFMLFSFTAFVYVPAGLTLILLQNVIGRKGMACGCLFMGGVITGVTGFLIAFLDRQQHSTLFALMIALGRYGSVVAYDAEAQYAAEIIPTSVRGRGMSFIHVAGYAFSFLSSYVIFLGTFYKPLPSIFISMIMFVGAALCLALPETLNKKLPETLSEGEKFGLNEKWYYFPCFNRRGKANSSSTDSVIESDEKRKDIF